MGVRVIKFLTGLKIMAAKVIFLLGEDLSNSGLSTVSLTKLRVHTRCHFDRPFRIADQV